MKPLLHFSFTNAGSAERQNQLKRVFDSADDWLRYTAENWFVETKLSPQAWYAKLEPVLRDEERVVIVRVDPRDHWGASTKMVWDWLAKKT